MSKERDRTRRGISTSRAPYACGGCKWMRKKCGEDCLLAPHFSPHNMQEFEACHRVFGFSNMQRMLKSLGEQERQEAANSMKWEASMWTQDPVYGPLGQYQKLLHENNNLINLLSRFEQEGQQCIQQQTHILRDSDESQLNREEKMTENR